MIVRLDELDDMEFDPNFILDFPPPRSKSGACLVTDVLPVQLLFSGYMQGMFPWFCENDGEPVVWYSPDPRFCLRMENLHVGRSIERFLKKTPYTYTMDRDFSAVIEECRKMNRKDQDGTWIGRKIIDSYTRLHEKGYAHSIEVWDGGELCGGFYGVLIGSVFFGESMFTLKPNSSKSAFVLFARAFEKCGGRMIDCQVYTDNMARYGASNISRTAFLRLEKEMLHENLKGDLKETFESLSESVKSVGNMV